MLKRNSIFLFLFLILCGAFVSGKERLELFQEQPQTARIARRIEIRFARVAVRMRQRGFERRNQGGRFAGRHFEFHFLFLLYAHGFAGKLQ